MVLEGDTVCPNCKSASHPKVTEEPGDSSPFFKGFGCTIVSCIFGGVAAEIRGSDPADVVADLLVGGVMATLVLGLWAKGTHARWSQSTFVLRFLFCLAAMFFIMQSCEKASKGRKVGSPTPDRRYQR